MTTNVPFLSYKPYQGGKAGSLVAVVNLDASVDTEFRMPVTGLWQNQTIFPDILIIFNQQNNGAVIVNAGAVNLDVPPYQRDYLGLSNSNVLNIDVQLTIGIVQLQFWKGTPPVNPSVINYAGATAVNQTAFPGGTTTGTAAAQAISVPSAFQFSNGFLVIGTSGFTNAGPVTMNVNMLGAIPVTKITAAGSVPLTGGEMVAGSDFILAVNQTSGTYDLVSSYPQARQSFPMVTRTLGGDVTLVNTNQYYIGPSIPQAALTGSAYLVEATFQLTGTTAGQRWNWRLTDGTTILDSGTFVWAGPNTPVTTSISASGSLPNAPAGDVRIEAECTNVANSTFSFNQSGNAMDCTITALQTT